MSLLRINEYIIDTTGNYAFNKLDLTANLTAGNANLGNAATANFFIGNGSQLTGLPASYANSNVETYLPTYTGNLSPSNLLVSTTANLGAVGNVTITGGTSGQVLSTNGSGTLSWSTMTAASITVDTFTGDGTTDEFTLSVTPANANVVTVNYNGATLLHDTYSLSGANIVFVQAPANGYNFDVTIVNAGTSSGGSSGASRVQSTILSMVFGG